MNQDHIFCYFCVILKTCALKPLPVITSVKYGGYNVIIQLYSPQIPISLFKYLF